MTPRVVVVGAGPAGLAAAIEAARAGAAVVVCDEQPAPGGSLRYRAQPIAAGPAHAAVRPGQLVAHLVADALGAGVEMRMGTVAAGCFAPRAVVVVQGDRAQRFNPDALIVATGSTDLPYPFAGATFPGVFSARGLRVLLNLHRVRPGFRFAIIGGGEDAEELAADVTLAGGEVVWSGIAPAPFLRAHGAVGVRELVVGQDRYRVDVIAIAVGRQADPALATTVGVPLAFAAELGGFVPVVDERMQSLVPGLFLAGDAAGVGSVTSAIAEGRLAGVAAAASLGLADEDSVEATRVSGGAELARRQALRAVLQPVAAQPFV